MNSKTISTIAGLLLLTTMAFSAEDKPAPPPAAAPAPGGAEPSAPGTPAPAAGVPRTPAAQRLAEGIQLGKARKHQEALVKLREAMTLKPDRALAAEILLETGREHYQMGSESFEGRAPESLRESAFREAIKVFEELIKTYPGEEKTAVGAYLLGTTYLFSDDTGKALASYQRVYDEYRTSKIRPDALIRVGICQAGLDQAGKARETFEKWLKEFPQNTAETPRIRKLIDETSIIGRPAFAIGSSQWLHGLVGPEGVKAFEGQVVVLVFFATWCPNCQKELPHLRSVMKKFNGTDVIFLGVANPEDPQATIPVEEYVQKNNLPFFDVALDRTQVSWRPYRVTGFPAAAIVDRKATVRWRGHLVFFPAGLVEKLLAEKG